MQEEEHVDDITWRKGQGNRKRQLELEWRRYFHQEKERRFSPCCTLSL